MFQRFDLKFLMLFICVFALLNQANAQHPFDESLNPLKDVLPPSPTASALATYGEIPVSLYTGIPNVSVPLGALQGRSLSLPISLSYHGGGNRVDAISSWVGMGWSLNAGGVITRTVNGIADDSDQGDGYLSEGIPANFLANPPTNPATFQEKSEATDFYTFLNGVSNKTKDGQPDQFNFNVNGYSGRFYLENVGGTITPRLVPHQNIKIEPTFSSGFLTKFVLTTPDGINYVFGGSDLDGVEAVEKTKTDQSGPGCGRIYNQGIITSWYLVRIEAPNATDHIDLYYDTHLMNYASHVSETHTTSTPLNQSVNTNCTATSSQNFCTTSLRVEGVHLKKIVAKRGSVEFLTTNTREDITSGGVRLTGVKFFGAKDQTNFTKKFVLNQDYWLSTNNTQTYTDKHKRLRLLGVQEIGANNNTSIPAYTFEYNSGLMPPRLSKDRDYWGFYNGPNGNTSLIPASIPGRPNFYPGGGNRKPDFTSTKAGVLQKIIYPTGGYTVLDYESNEKGLEIPIQEVVSGVSTASAEYGYPSSGANSQTNAFTINFDQDVTVNYNIDYRTGAPAAIVSYLKIEEKINGVWQPLTTANSNVNQAITNQNDGKGTIKVQSYHPTEVIDEPIMNSFTLNLAAGEYRIIANALNTDGTYPNVNTDNLSISIFYENQTGNLIYNEIVGGLRINQMLIHDGLDASKDIVKVYDYNRADDANISSGYTQRIVDFESNRIVYTYESYCAECFYAPDLSGEDIEYIVIDLTGNGGTNSYVTSGGLSAVNFTGTQGTLNVYEGTGNEITTVCEQNWTTKFSESQLSLNGVVGNHVAYEEVSVLEGLNGTNGKTWNKYTRDGVGISPNIGVAGGTRLPEQMMDWRAGQLINQIVYKNENGTFVPLSETINEYSVSSIAGDNSLYVLYGMGVAKNNLYQDALTLVFDCNPYNINPANQPGTTYPQPSSSNDIYVPHPCEGYNSSDYFINYVPFGEYSYVYYPIFSGWQKLDRTISRQYNEAGTNYLETITEFEYDHVYTHTKRTAVTNSDGTKYISETTFPTDYTTTSSSTGTALAIHNLKADHRHAVPIESTKYIEKAGQAKKLLGGMLTTFETKSNGLVVPHAIYRSEIVTPLSLGSFSPSTIDVNNNFSFDQNIYTAYGEYLGHDDYGNALGFKQENYIANSYAYGYDNMLPIMGATNAHFSEIGYTSFEEGDEDGWTINGSPTSTTGKVGQQALQVDSNEEFPLVRVFDVDGQHKKYKFSAWVKSGGAVTSYLVLQTFDPANPGVTFPNTNIADSYVQTSFGFTNGEWELVEVEIDLDKIRQDAGLSTSQMLSIQASLWNPYAKKMNIDAVRFQPSDAFIRTVDYDNNTYLTVAMEGENRRSSSYFYDDFQRLHYATDFEGNILATNEYDFQIGGTNRSRITTKALRKSGVYQLNDLVGLPVEELVESYQYMDGLGRVIQNVAKQQSPQKKDVVSFVEYDNLGRVPVAYLPFVNPNNTTGNYNSNSIADNQTFYNSLIETEGQTVYPYGETVFEASPANRPKEQSSAGNGWQIGGNQTAKSYYELNGKKEVLYLDNQSSTIQYYPARTLIKSRIVNERGATAIAYTDMLGRTVMTKQEVDPGVWAATYTLYNDFGNVAAVISPLAIEQMIANGNYDYSNAAYSELIYLYEYDQRQRVISKKIPNAAIIEYIYDPLDRVVATQDGNQAAQNKWLTTKYDVYSRPILTAMQIDTRTRVSLQAAVNLFPTYFEENERVGTGTTTGYTNTVLPFGPNDEVLTISYYDDYDFDRDGIHDLDNSFIQETGYPTTYFNRTITKPTGTKVRILDGVGTMLKTVMFYDDRDRVIQTQPENFLSGTDFIFNSYNFIGELLKSKRKHTATVEGNTQNITTEETYEYDHSGRLTAVYHQIDNEAPVLLHQDNYDELGRLIEKNLHSVNTVNFLQSVDYRYNVKNWLLSINDVASLLPQPDATSGDGEVMRSVWNNPEYNDDLFAMNFDYDPVGNIDHLEWRVQGNGYRSIYDVSYDYMNRMKSADYQEFIESSVLMPTYQRIDEFTVNWINYDVNGNILRLNRKGNTPDPVNPTYTNGMIDELIYSYNGNQLVAVNDLSGSIEGFKNGANTSAEYQYDVNGNMIQDDNKGITVEYNHLNLPTRVVFTALGHEIRWTYDAAGNKLRKDAHPLSTDPVNKYYLGGIEYLDENLEAVYHSEGRITRSLAGTDKGGNPLYAFQYEYNIKDHLGNTRVAFADLNQDGIVQVGKNGDYNELIQQNHYYPFGMNMQGHWDYDQPQIGVTNAYQYNGKELNEDWGLNWNDYGARWYDASLARWHNVDPLADQFSGWSPYSYCYNNPLRFIDPDGKAPDPVFGFLLRFTVGFGSNDGLQWSATGTISGGFRGDHIQGVGDISISLYQGGLGTSEQAPFGFDATLAMHGTFGGGLGQREEMNIYTLNYNTVSAVQNPYANSGTYGLIWNYNSSINEVMNQGLIGAKVGDFSTFFNNDLDKFSLLHWVGKVGGFEFPDWLVSQTDYGWTGGIIVSMLAGGDLIEGGYQSFTGRNYGKDTYTNPATGKKTYKQNTYDLSLNRASTFVRYNGVTIDLVSDGWFQHFIHDYVVPTPRFRYDLRGGGASVGVD